MKQRKKILLLDEDLDLLAKVQRALMEHNAWLDVFLATSCEAASAIVDEHRIGAIALETKIAGRSTAKFLCWVSSESPHTLIVTTSEKQGACAGCQNSHGCGILRHIDKPYEPQNLANLVVRLVKAQSRLSGTLDGLSCADFVQMLCVSCKSATLRLRDKDGVGMIAIDRGLIVDASWNAEVGERGLFQLLPRSSGRIELLPLLPVASQTINADWQHLMLEAMRLEDEKQAGLSDGIGSGPLSISSPNSTEMPPPTERAPDAPAESATERYDRLIAKGIEMMKKGDLASARKAWKSARLAETTS